MNPALYTNMGFDPVNDLAPISLVANVATVLVVPPSLPVSNVNELIALARAKPGQLNFASGGVASFNQLCAELLKMTAKIDIVHVPYKGGAPAVADLVGAKVDLLFTGAPVTMSHIKAGKLKVLAVTDSQRSAALPDTPTMGESLPGYEFNNWYGIMAPGGHAARARGAAQRRSAPRARAARRAGEGSSGWARTRRPSTPGEIRRGHEDGCGEVDQGDPAGRREGRLTDLPTPARSTRAADRRPHAPGRWRGRASPAHTAPLLAGSRGSTSTSCPSARISSITPAAMFSSMHMRPGKYSCGGKELGKFTLEKRGASIACCSAMPNCVTFRNTCIIAGACTSPPGVPKHMKGLPSFMASAGLGVSRGRLPAATCAGWPAARRDCWPREDITMPVPGITGVS
jgi:hypothetical protein